MKQLSSRVFITNTNLYRCMVLRTSRWEAGIVNHSCLVFSFHFLGFTFHNADIFASCWMDSGKESSSSWNSDKITGRRSAFVTRRKRRKEKGKKKKEIRKSTQREWAIRIFLMKRKKLVCEKKLQKCYTLPSKNVCFVSKIFPANLKLRRKYINIQRRNYFWITENSLHQYHLFDNLFQIFSNWIRHVRAIITTHFLSDYYPLLNWRT